MKLYPRLSRRFAHDEFARQAALGPNELAVTADTTHALITWPATGASRVTPQELANLRAEIVAAAEQHAWPRQLSQVGQRELDLLLARILWERADLSPAEAGFGDVWSFIAMVLVPEVVWWRAAGSTNIERFVASDLTRHTLARLWWRAQLFTYGLDDPEEGWELWRSSSIGEADLDQIQTRRGGYGRSPKVFRALVRLYPVFTELASTSGIERRRLWRDQYLRWLLRIGAFTNFSGLPEAELVEEFEVLARRLEGAAAPPSRTSVESLRSDAITGIHEFDALPLSMVVVHVAQAVRSGGELADEELYEAFEHAAGCSLPPSRREIVYGIAWQGVPLHYLAHEGEAGASTWRPGRVLPAPDRRWGEWSIESFKEHVAASNRDTDRDRLAAELFSGRAGRTVRRVVRAAVQETRMGER